MLPPMETNVSDIFQNLFFGREAFKNGKSLSLETNLKGCTGYSINGSQIRSLLPHAASLQSHASHIYLQMSHTLWTIQLGKDRTHGYQREDQHNLWEEYWVMQRKKNSSGLFLE